MLLRRSLPALLLLTFWPLFASAEELLPGGENPGYHPQPEWFRNSFLDMGEEVAGAAGTGKRVVLYFYQDGCPYCAKLLRDNFGDEGIAAYTRDHFEVIALNMWGDREVTWLDGTVYPEKRFAEELRVMFTPTLLFLTEEGRVALRVNGYYPPDKFLSALHYVAEHREGELGFAAYHARRAPPTKGGALRREPWMLPQPLDLGRRSNPDRPLLLLVEQKGCPACDEWHREAFTRPEVRALLEGMEVAQLDMWGAAPVVTPAGERLTEAQWAQRLEVKYAPSMLFFVDGKEVFRSEAYLRPFHIRNVLDYVASGAYRTQPSLQRFIEARAAAMRERGESVDLMR